MKFDDKSVFVCLKRFHEMNAVNPKNLFILKDQGLRHLNSSHYTLDSITNGYENRYI